MTVPSRPDALKYEILLLLMAVIWGTAYVAQYIGMEKNVGALTFTGIRFALGALTLLPVIWLRGKTKGGRPTEALPWRGCIMAGFFLFAAAAFQQLGLKYTSCANAGFITGLYIVFVPMFAMFLGHKTNASLWVGVVIALIGFYFLSITDQFTIGTGDLLVLACAFFWTGQILVIDRTARAGDPIKIACIQFAICAVLSLAASIFFETWSITTLKDGMWAMLYAGCISAGLAFTLQVVCQKRCPPGPAAVIMSMEAVFAAISGYLFLKQSLSARSLLGCSLMFLGMLTVQLTPIVRKKFLAQPAS